MKKTDGFTLIEVLIVIALVGILAAIAIPNYISWLPNYRLKAAARDLYSSLQHAKLEAVKRNTCVGVVFTTVVFPIEGGSYTSFVDDGRGGGTPCNGTQDGGEINLFAATVAPPDVSIFKATNIGAASGVCFNSKGAICGSQMGDIQLRNNRSRWYKVTVSAIGGLRLESSGDGSTWGN